MGAGGVQGSLSLRYVQDDEAMHVGLREVVQGFGGERGSSAHVL